MRIKVTAPIIIIGFIMVIFFSFTAIAVIDAPHNASNNISCGSCHGEALHYSAFWGGSFTPADIDDTPYNRICLSCHTESSPGEGGYPQTKGPWVKTHSSLNTSNKYGDWTRECRTCHDPHYQKQKNYKNTDAGNLYLATGTITSCVYNGDGPSTLTYSTITYKSGWDSTKLTQKTGDYRRTILFPNVGKLGYNYPIIGVDEGAKTITVTGDARAYLYPPTTFAVIYGQYVKDSIDIKADPSVSPPPASIYKTVKFFDQAGTKSFADGDITYNGVCEVCHTQTTHFRNNGGAPDQWHTNICDEVPMSNCKGCHTHSGGFKESDRCIDCHSISFCGRAAITPKFNSNSHHVQGASLTDEQCYQCHWEANFDGNINTTYHEGYNPSTKTGVSGAKVDLVIYGDGVRPTGETYTSGVTGIAYTANGDRAEIQKINSHCLGCHSDQNNSITPFGDGKTPKQYAWEGTSVAAKYSQTGTTTWGKYSGANITTKNTQTKAYSAHGNAINNQGGWDLNETWPNTRSGSENIACFDCHNSHGSTVSGTTTSYTSATTSGGILKDTLASKGGYSLTYKPVSGGSTDNKNAYNPGAGLCFDCHMTAASGTTPWGYNSTFGATQPIMGYWDTPYFGPGTFGSQSRYAYKASATHKGGHFGASSTLSGSPTGTINGLCTPCHDPHGVSSTLGTNQQYSVPLLKGTWLTSLYKEDVAPANNTTWTITDVNAGNVYHIDQNTFGSNIRDAVTGITQTDTQFAGLCLTCHTKNSLTDGNNGGTWKSIDRIHESVKGWGANAKHKYPCSKCHATHNSRLPRLMVTNCLNYVHKGRVGSNGNPVLSGSGYDCGYYEGGDGQPGGPLGDGNGPGCGSGSGRFPGSYSGYDQGDHTVTCHENNAADQSWNVKIQWAPPTLTSPTATSIGSTTATLGANVTFNGGSAITARGTVWGTSSNPTGNALAEGGTTTGVFSHARSSLTVGTKIYYRGYATNNSGTGYSPDGSFYTEPSTQASNVNFTSVGSTGMTVNWTRGNGDGVIVLMKQGSEVSSDPADGTYTGYTANAAFGSGTQIGTTGNYVIYKGTGASVAVTGLTGGTTYYVAVYEYKGTVDTSGVNQGTNYKPSPATGSQTTNLIVPTLTSPTATGIGSTTATLGANVTFNGGLALTARGTVWGTSSNPTGNALAEGGTTTGVFTHSRTGLPAGTKIYYRGYATNNSGTGYSPDGSFYTEPSTQASNVNFTSVGSTGMTVNWTRGNGDGVIVLMKQGSAVSSNPVDGTYTGYTANAAFGSGTQIGTGNYVIYKGPNPSIAVTGLTLVTTYHVAVYEYKGTVDTSGVNQGTNYITTSPAIGNQTTSSPAYSFTFNYTGDVQTLNIPAGATNIQFTVKGGGGGGGRDDSENNQESGQNGHSVVMSYSTSGVTLSIYVGGGGTEGSTEVWGASGGWGYHSGGAGGAGDDFRPYGYDDWGYGGAGGGGSSAILSGGSTLLAEAAGGAGGRSSDWDGTGGCDPGYCENYTYGGPGGAGGGSDYPSPGTTGGGTGGGTATPGGLGQVVITYDY